MIGRGNTPQLITAEEAVAISLRAGTTEEIHRAVEIAAEYQKREPTLIAERGDTFYRAACLYATIWEAGRIQGIREERSKQKKRPQEPIAAQPMRKA